MSNLKNWFGLQKQIFFESLSHDLSRKCNSGRPFIRWAQTVSPSQRQCWPHGDQALKILLQFSSPHRHDCCCCCCCCAFYYLKHLTGGTWGGGKSGKTVFMWAGSLVQGLWDLTRNLKVVGSNVRWTFFTYICCKNCNVCLLKRRK